MGNHELLIRNEEEARELAGRLFLMRFPNKQVFFNRGWRLIRDRHHGTQTRADFATVDASDLSVVGAADAMSLEMIQEVAVFFESFMTKFPAARDELIKKVAVVCAKYGREAEYVREITHRIDSALGEKTSESKKQFDYPGFLQSSMPQINIHAPVNIQVGNDNTATLLKEPQDGKSASPAEKDTSETVPSHSPPPKPLTPEELEELKKHPWKDMIIAKSRAMLGVFREMNNVVNSDVAVFINGETGTGKELIAKALHKYGSRNGKIFHSINCGAIAANMAESELFGHKKGAFTDAKEGQVGAFEFANGGTLFLDEIADFEPHNQVKILRVLQEHKVRPMGSNKDIEVDVRIITATHKNLQSLIKAGKFREDLYYRLVKYTLNVLPLRERQEEIPLLAEYLLQKYEEKEKIEVKKQISPAAMDVLVSHRWPGNVRELENVIINASLRAKGSNIIKDAHVLAALGQQDNAKNGSTIDDPRVLAVIDELRKIPQNEFGRFEKACDNCGQVRSTLRRQFKNLSLNHWDYHA